MSSLISLFLVCVMLIVLPVMSSIAKRKRFEASMKRYLDERALREKEIQTPVKKSIDQSQRMTHVLPQKDLIRNYSQKNKECYEHEVMVSSLDSEKTKRKKSLWNEPSWEDELYAKK